MKTQKIIDERILSQRRNIQSHAYSVLISCLLISILFQQFVLNAPFSQVAAEFFSLIAAGIYVVASHLYAGIDIWDANSTSKKKLLFNSILGGLICVISLVVIAGERNTGNMALIFISFTVAFFIGHSIIYNLVRKKQKEIDEELNKEE